MTGRTKRLGSWAATAYSPGGIEGYGRATAEPWAILHRLLRLVQRPNDRHPLTTLARLTPNQAYMGQGAENLTARQVRQAQALDHCRDADHAPLSLEELTSSRCPSG